MQITENLTADVRRAIAIGSVIAIMAATLLRAFGGPPALFAVLVAAIALLIAVEYRTIPSNLRNTSLILFAISAILLPFANTPLAAVQRGVFVSGLLLALMASVILLARCALRSRQVRLVGESLRGQAPARRQLSFNVASQLFSATLSLAGANIMFVMASPEDNRSGDTASIIAITRGFTAAAFWSPMFGNMAILLVLYPSLQWIEVFPVGFMVAQLTVVVGVLMHRFSLRTPPEIQPERAADFHPDREWTNATITLLIAMFGFLGTILATSTVLKISITASIVLLGPVFALLLNIGMAGDGNRIAKGMRQVREDAAQFPRLSSEALLFAAAGCAGTIMAAAFPDRWVEWIGATFGSFPLFGIGFLMFSIIGLALAGIHPVLSAVFMASTITPHVLSLPALIHCSAILIGWGLSASLTPYSVLVLTASRYSNATPFQLSMANNWRFAVANSLLACLALTAVALALR
jgi:hypothetical protein